MFHFNGRSRFVLPIFLILTIGLLTLGVVQAGDLEPPDAPAPTMVTLQQIYDVIESGGGSGAAIQSTAQNTCWDAAGSPINCGGTGQDGELGYGASVSTRFTDNGDGTATDLLTGLTWLKDADCFGLEIWSDALSESNALADGSCGLTDGSVAGDWRLPNVRELQSLIHFVQFDPALDPGHPFSDVQIVLSSYYWTSTTAPNATSSAYRVFLRSGAVDSQNKTSAPAGAHNNYVWPVRGGL